MSATVTDLTRRATAELIGTALLLAAVVGSGIMGDRLAAGNTAIVLANTIGIRPADVPGFVVAQLVGAGLATAVFRWLVSSLPKDAPSVVVPHQMGVESNWRNDND